MNNKTPKKIAIITMHRTDNYGAVLQAFALKKTCDNYGSVRILDYKNEHAEKSLMVLIFPKSFRALLRFAKDLLRLKNRKVVTNKFNQFVCDNLSLCHFNEKQFNESSFDIYVSGSDQIWNPKCVNANGVLDQTYFLSFAKHAKKMSYASSMGSYTYSRVQEALVKNLLSNFNNISVRESDAAERLSPLTSKEIKVVLDPTLLLESKDYLALCPNPDVTYQKPFILIYSIQKTKHLHTLIASAKSIFPRHNFLVLEQDPWNTFRSCETIRTAGPIDFIELCRSSEGILTDSFHGVCFSMVFKKPFVVANPIHHPNRIEDLLNRLGEEARLSRPGDDVKEQVSLLMSSEPGSDRLAALRQQSFEFLEDGLS